MEVAHAQMVHLKRMLRLAQHPNEPGDDGLLIFV